MPTKMNIKEAVRGSWLIHPYRAVRDGYWKSRDYVLDQLASSQPRLAFKLLTTAIPKSGTHLIMEALRNISEIKRRPLLLKPRVPVTDYRAPLEKLALNRYAYGHLGVNEETVRLVKDFGLSVLVMLRDPRDLVVSHVDHAFRLKPSILREFYGSLEDDHARLKAAIAGVPPDRYPRIERVAAMGGYEMLTGYADIGKVCRGYLAWGEVPGIRVHFVHYRDLIGERGGGTRERQFEATKKIIEFLKLDYSDAKVSSVCDRTYSTKSVTFNKGGQNRWKSVFTPELKDLFKKFAARELIEMGYEKDNNW